jgi:site-specific DNA recombinase
VDFDDEPMQVAVALFQLDLGPEAAPVVARIYEECIDGRGFYVIAEGLTRDGIPSPSAHDPGRNRHRSGIAWNKLAVRSILIDVEDIALGHVAKMRWNDANTWVWRGRSPPERPDPVRRSRH